MAEVTEHPGPVTALRIGQQTDAQTAQSSLGVLVPTRLNRQEGWRMVTLYGSMLGLSLDGGQEWAFADITSERNQSFVRSHYPGILEELGMPISYMEVLEQGTTQYLVQNEGGHWVGTKDHPRRWPLARIEEAGLYEVEKKQTADDGPNPGQVVRSSFPVFVKSTTKIPAQPGITFGYFIDISFGEPGRVYEVRQIQRHPPMTLPDGRKVEKTEVAPVTWEAGGFQHIRFPNLFSFIENYPYEIVPGTWVFETHVDGRKVAERAFMVEPAATKTSP